MNGRGLTVLNQSGVFAKSRHALQGVKVLFKLVAPVLLGKQARITAVVCLPPLSRARSAVC